MEWYIAKVIHQNVQTIKTYLNEHGVVTYSPEIVSIKRGTHRMEPLFPGYVFVQTDLLSEDWALVRWARGLSYLLPTQMQPEPVAESLVEEIMSCVERWNLGGWSTAHVPGDQVRIEYGSALTLDAIFERYLPGGQRCQVLISLLGGRRRAQVEITKLSRSTVRQLPARSEI